MKQLHYRQTNWSPLRAIRERCLWCTAGQKEEIVSCSSRKCPLHSYRTGTPVHSPIKVLKAIRSKCIDCASGVASNVARCDSRNCPLWDFRFGKNPYCV